MVTAIMLSRQCVSPKDILRYWPPFSDPYRGELAEVVEIIKEDSFEAEGANGTPYWVKVLFEKDVKKDGKDAKEKQMCLKYFILEEACTSVQHR